MRRIYPMYLSACVTLCFGSCCGRAADDGMIYTLPLTEVGSGHIERCGRVSSDDSGVVARLDLLFMQQEGGGGMVPLPADAVEIVPSYFATGRLSLEDLQAIRKKREHEAFGSMALAGIESPGGSVGVSFNVVQTNYAGTGWGVLMAGQRYMVRMQSPRVAECWLEVPNDIVPGSVYEALWIVEPKGTEKKRINEIASSLIHCSVAPSLLSKSTGILSAFYRHPKEETETEKVVGASGVFDIMGRTLGGELTLYTGRGNAAAAICTISRVEKRMIALPDDATQLYDHSQFVSAEICIDPELEITQELILAAVYASEDSQVPLCFRYMNTTGLMSDRTIDANTRRKNAIVSFAFLPGEYEARVYQQGRLIGSAVDTQELGRKMVARCRIRLTNEAAKNSFFIGSKDSFGVEDGE